MSININRLGLRLDGWADLIEGAGSKAGEALNAALESMKSRSIPGVIANPEEISAGFFSNKRRPYMVAQMSNGSSATVYIGRYGSDLYASWDLYVRPLPNWRTLLIILGVALLLVSPCGISGLLTGLAGLGGSLGQRGGSLEAGLAMGSIIGSVFLSCFGVIFTSAFLAVLVGVAGQIVRGNPLAFFFKELDTFDADDIGAMALAVHKSVLHALDRVGISIQTLRLKEQFRAGSRERLI
jgi:hypothetical protein